MKKDKKSRIKRIILVALVAIIVIATGLVIARPEILVALKPAVECEEICPGVIDLGTYTDLDYDFAEDLIERTMFQYNGGCSAMAKTLDNGDMVVGRNFDYYVCNYPVYVMRTKQEGLYETIGSTMMIESPFQELDEAKEGVSNLAYQLLPFMMMDSMNSEGLYIEINMRHGETDEDGKGLFISSGTNPESDHRVLLSSLPLYVASNCATVDEALEYLKTLDIYSDPSDESWGFGFMLSDATGRHGVLEIAKNKIYWTEGQQYHTNFYIEDDLNQEQKYQIGTGRYEVLANSFASVHTEADLASLMDSISYRQVSSNHCQFDSLSEFTGDQTAWTYDFVTDPTHEAEVKKSAAVASKKLQSTPREQMTIEDDIWETTYRIIANLTDRTLTYRFFEKDDCTVTLGF